MYGARAWVRQKSWEIRRWRSELNDDRRLIRRGHTQRVGLLLAVDDVASVRHDIDDLRVLRSRCRIDEPAKAGNEIFGDDLVAVRPARIRAEREGVRLAVRADAPLLRNTRRGAGVFRESRQSFAEITQDRLRLDGARALGIERIRIRPIAAQEDVVG